jgi:hypothetical protein
MKYLFNIIVLLLISNLAFAQTNWKSKMYNYQVEIPNGFSIISAVGANVDFKAGDKFGNSIVIVVKKIPFEFKNQSIYQTLGNLSDYAIYWQEGANEIFNTPKLIKYGKTKINNYDAFWLDYTTDNDAYYYKNYSVKKGDLIFAITFFASKNRWNNYSATWFRFKEKIIF